MVAVLRRKEFTLLWCANLLSTLGDWVLFAALPFYIYQRTGSAVATGAMFIANTLPRLLFSSLAGVLADRLNKQRLMIAADLARAVLLVMYFAVPLDDWFWLLYVIAFAETSVSLLFGPARGALIPHLVPKEQLIKANALESLSGNTCRLIGPLLGGALLTMVGLEGAVVIDIASYLLSAVLVCLVRLPASVHAVEQQVRREQARESFWRTWSSGLEVLWKEPWLRVFFSSTALATVAQGILNVLLVVFVSERLGGGSQVFGLLVSAQGIGGIVGGLLVGLWNRALRPPQLMTASLLCISAIFLLFVNIPNIPAAVALMTLMGVPVVGWMTAMATMMQTGIRPDYRGRVLGAFANSQSLMMILGMALASLLNGALSVVTLLNVSGLLLLGAGLLSRQLEALVERPAPNATETGPVPASAPPSV